MKIGNTDDISSYLNRLTQGTQNNRTQNAGTSGKFSPSSMGQGSGDSLEISGQAYESLSGGANSGGAGGKMTPPDPSQALSDLVNDGTITSDQASAVTTAMKFSSTSTSDDTNPLKSTLDDLVTAGTLTSDQASSIATALAPPQMQDETSSGSQSGSDMSNMGPPPPPPDGQRNSDSNPISDALSSLVDAGTITSDQADAITSALQDALKSGTASGKSGTSSTGTSDTASTTGTTTTSATDSTDSTNPLKSLLEGLVSDGKITEDQASAVAQAMTPPTPPMDMGMSMGGSGDDNSDSSISDVTASSASSTTSASGTISASDQKTSLIKDILNSQLSNGTVSTGYLSSVIKFLNSLDNDTLQSIGNGLQSGTTASDS